MPILKRKVPKENMLIRAENIMSERVICLRSVDSVKRIYEALKSTHHAFPIVNMSGQIIGIIPKNYLIVLIKKKCYYSHPNQKYIVLNGNLKKYFKEAFERQALKNYESHHMPNLSNQLVDEQVLNEAGNHDSNFLNESHQHHPHNSKSAAMSQDNYGGKRADLSINGHRKSELLRSRTANLKNGRMGHFSTKGESNINGHFDPMRVGGSDQAMSDDLHTVTNPRKPFSFKEYFDL
mmetsp:Transcript_17794/g.30150  ORF Transcript_17794/g.30150 Transcript_17794/m.30150 type:complete len:236 (+) Transcript_17794:1832-2539(+)